MPFDAILKPVGARLKGMGLSVVEYPDPKGGYLLIEHVWSLYKDDDWTLYDSEDGSEQYYSGADAAIAALLTDERIAARAAFAQNRALFDAIRRLPAEAWRAAADGQARLVRVAMIAIADALDPPA